MMALAVPGHKVGQGTAHGDFAVAVASANVNHPHALYVRVKSRPHQRASGAYTVVCSRGFGAGSKSANFHGRTTFYRRMRMPYHRPSSCSVSADAQLSHGGFIKVQIYA